MTSVYHLSRFHFLKFPRQQITCGTEIDKACRDPKIGETIQERTKNSHLPKGRQNGPYDGYFPRIEFFFFLCNSLRSDPLLRRDANDIRKL